MTKFFDFKWRLEVDKEIMEGATFDRWTEEKDDTDYEPDCLFKVDEYGFFVYWKSAQKPGDCLELRTVSDIRRMKLPKDPKLAGKLTAKHGNDVEDKMLGFCYGANYVQVHLINIVCKDKAQADRWQASIRKVTNKSKMSNVCPKTNLLCHWHKLCFQTDIIGKIPVKNIMKTFASGKTDKLVLACLSEAGLPCEKGAEMNKELFTFQIFYDMYLKISPRTDIDELFRMITKGEFINMAQMITFMNECQRDPELNQVTYPMYDEKRCLQIITAHEPEQTNIDNKRFSKAGLLEFLMSDENAPVFLDRLDIFQDMTQSIAHYYMNSSHNTYLSGKQVGAKSNAEMYRQSLLAGCRCVELDCWDGKGVDEEPIITHGKAYCTEISAEECFEAIGNTAFVTSEYPVVLSFENHCCKKQQLKLAKFCEKYFGDLLGKEPMAKFPLGPGKRMPGPIHLKNKILIKNKRLKPEAEKAELEIYLKGGQLQEEEAEDPDAPPAPKKEEKEGEAPTPAAYAGTSITNIHPLLSSYVNYAQPVHFMGFDKAEEKDIHHNMSSFSETTALAYLKNQSVDFVNYNKRQMSRIYPKGTRVDSSNYMPQIFWNSGCQIVALNFQTPDLPMQLNGGKFEYNGNCGYLIKPDFMRLADKQFDPFAESAVDGVVAKEIGVKIIAGQFLSDKKVGTYVEIDMYGLPADTVRKEFRTGVIPNNALNPQYTDDQFTFRKVVLPDLAVLRFGVFNEGGDFLGMRILPLDGLQSGYHHISLRTEGNFPISLAMLFVCISNKVYIPDGMGDMLDALSDPRAFMNAQEKRDQQLKAMGIDTSDTGGVVLKGGAAKKPGAKGKPGEKGKDAKKEEDPFMTFDPITIEFVTAQKTYQKANKKGQKEIDATMKKLKKERETMQKKHCTAIEKEAKGKTDVENDPAIQKMVTEQMKTWTELINRHRCQEWTIMKNQIKNQEALIKDHFKIELDNQVKALEADFEKRNKEMKANQAKTAVELVKEINADKTLKSKADKDRRIKEKQQANTKNVINERKQVGIKQGKAKDKLQKSHEKQLAAIGDEIASSIQFYESAEEELKRRSRMEFYC